MSDFLVGLVIVYGFSHFVVPVFCWHIYNKHKCSKSLVRKIALGLVIAMTGLLAYADSTFAYLFLKTFFQ